MAVYARSCRICLLRIIERENISCEVSIIDWLMKTYRERTTTGTLWSSRKNYTPWRKVLQKENVLKCSNSLPNNCHYFGSVITYNNEIFNNNEFVEILKITNNYLKRYFLYNVNKMESWQISWKIKYHFFK